MTQALETIGVGEGKVAVPPHHAPSPAQLAAELGIKPRSAFVKRLPNSIQVFLTNRKGMIGLTILAIFVLLALFAPLITPYNPYRSSGKPHVQPGFEHVLGTTRQGKDVFSQLIVGGRTSLTVGFVWSWLALVAGFVVFFLVLARMLFPAGRNDSNGAHHE